MPVCQICMHVSYEQLGELWWLCFGHIREYFMFVRCRLWQQRVTLRTMLIHHINNLYVLPKPAVVKCKGD